MLDYKIKVDTVHDGCKKNSLGVFEPEIIFKNSYHDIGNPLNARKEAFNKLESFIDIFSLSKKKGDVSNVFADRFYDLYNNRGIVPTIELWIDIKDEDLKHLLDKSNIEERELLDKFDNPLFDIFIDAKIGRFKNNLPSINRLLFTNINYQPHQITDNLAREFIYYTNRNVDIESATILDNLGNSKTVIKSDFIDRYNN